MVLFTKKKSKDDKITVKQIPESPAKPKPQQQPETSPAKSAPVVFRKGKELTPQQRQPPKMSKPVRPLPDLSTDNDTGEELYNDVADPDIGVEGEYGDTDDVPGSDPQPLYENVQYIMGSISGANAHPPVDDHVYGNVDYVN